MRIGLSLGEASVEDGDYFGEPVVEASRLCAAAEGGQILVSDLVRQVGGARDGYRFRSLGGLELKGISEPVQAFELAVGAGHRGTDCVAGAAARAAGNRLRGARGRARAA